MQLYYNTREVILMAEFCLECWNKIMGSDDPPQKYIFSSEPELCEECGEWKLIIIRIKQRYVFKEWKENAKDYFSRKAAENSGDKSL